MPAQLMHVHKDLASLFSLPRESPVFVPAQLMPSNASSLDGFQIGESPVFVPAQLMLSFLSCRF